MSNMQVDAFCTLHRKCDPRPAQPTRHIGFACHQTLPQLLDTIWQTWSEAVKIFSRTQMSGPCQGKGWELDVDGVSRRSKPCGRQASRSKLAYRSSRARAGIRRHVAYCKAMRLVVSSQSLHVACCQMNDDKDARKQSRPQIAKSKTSSNDIELAASNDNTFFSSHLRLQVLFEYIFQNDFP
jgi:hypothetical protein